LKLKLVRRLEPQTQQTQQKEDEHNMSKTPIDEPWDDKNIVQYSLDDIEGLKEITDNGNDNLKGDSDMGMKMVNGVNVYKDMSEEDMEKLGAEASLKMGNLDLVNDKGDNNDDKGDFPSMSNISDKNEKDETKGEKNKENDLVEWEIEDVKPLFINKQVKKYSCHMSAGLLATMANEGQIFYNKNTQRGLVKKAKGFTPKISTSKIRQIYSKLISGELNGMLITLNARILKNENGNIINEIEFDEDNNNTLTGTGYLDAVDGWHRIYTSQYWLRKWEKNKSLPSPWEYNFIVAIERMPEPKAGILFSEYGATPTKISSSKVKYLDIDDYSNMIVRSLLTSVLRNKVEIDKTSTKKTNHIVTFSTLDDAIKKSYKISTEDSVDSITKHLVAFFNKLISMYPDYFGNMSLEEREKARNQDNLILELLMFHGYISASARLYGKEDWESKLMTFKNTIKIDGWEGNVLQPDCPLWKNKIFRGDGKIVSGTTTQNYVRKVLGNYVEFGLDYTINNIKEEETSNK